MLVYALVEEYQAALCPADVGGFLARFTHEKIVVEVWQ